MADSLGMDKTGLKTVIAEEFSSRDAVPGATSADQLPLLPLPAVVPDTEDARENGFAPRGVGRPAGSRNKSTEEWRSYLLKNYRSPLIGMAEIFNRSLKQLGTDLGVTDLTFDKSVELLKIQLQCMKELAPYMHQKMPTAIEAGEGGLINLTINGVGAAAKEAVRQGGLGVEFLDEENHENQGFIEATFTNSVANNSVKANQTVEKENENAVSTTDLGSAGEASK